MLGNLAVGFGALSVALSFQADWSPASIGSNGAVWYVSKSSIKDVTDSYNGPARKAWVRVDFSKVKSVAEREAKILVFVKCNEEQLKTTTWVSYRADGSVLEDMSTPLGPYKPVIPDTVMSGVMRAVCDGQFIGDYE